MISMSAYFRAERARFFDTGYLYFAEKRRHYRFLMIAHPAQGLFLSIPVSRA